MKADLTKEVGSPGDFNLLKCIYFKGKIRFNRPAKFLNLRYLIIILKLIENILEPDIPQKGYQIIY